MTQLRSNLEDANRYVPCIQSNEAQTHNEMGKIIGALKQMPEASLIGFAQASRLIHAKLP